MLILKKQKNTAGTRHLLQLTKNLLFKNNKIIKNLNLFTSKKNGHSSKTGHITVWHRGGGCKRIYKKINSDFNTVYSLIIGIIYDCNKTNLNTVNFNLLTKQFFYSNTILNTYPGSLLACQENLNELYLGYKLTLKNIPIGSLISNISIKKINKIVKSAGTFAQIIQKNDNICKVRLPSNKVVNINIISFATLGINANPNQNKIIIAKAGRNRWKGIRPTVRGIAMNPVDHPHGGRSNGGCHPMTPWGVCTKGKKTRSRF